MPLDHAFNTNVHTELQNSWWLHAGVTWSGVGDVYCDRCARGGPALKLDQAVSTWGGIQGDERKRIIPEFWFNYWQGDEARSHFVSVEPYVRFRLSGRLTMSTGVSYQKNRDDKQWFDNFTDPDGTTHYTFAHLEQETQSLTGRLDFTATPTITLQVYASPFITKGEYSNLRELNEPRAGNYDDRFKPYTAVEPGGFNFKEFRSNVVGAVGIPARVGGLPGVAAGPVALRGGDGGSELPGRPERVIRCASEQYVPDQSLLLVRQVRRKT